MAFDVIESKTEFEGRVFDVRVEKVRMPDGRQASIDVVAHEGAVTLVPVDESGQVWFIRQYRHAAGESLLELPAGVMEAEEGAEYSAGRELREEIGMAAENLRKLGEFFLAPGYSTEYMYVFLATGLYDSPLDQDEDEAIEVEKIPALRALQMVEQGEIRDAKTIAALCLARSYLEEFNS